MSISNSNFEWADRGRSVWMGGAVRPDLCIASGSGVRLVDVEGRSYLDFVGGWAVSSLGHSPVAVSRALERQSRELVHCSPGFWNRPGVELAESLARLSGFDRVFLGCTGAEANECAIKLARKHGAGRGADRIVCTDNGFHGRTLATMAATGKPAWKNLFSPEMPGFVHVPFGNPDALREAMDGTVCAVMFEPVQGEGGVVPASREFAATARELCDRQGALLVLDEVQTGLGRCGTLFAFERLGIRPDVATLAKGLGAGFPVSACLATRDADRFEPGDQGGTHTYHPLGAAVGSAVLEEIVGRNLVEHAAAMGSLLRTHLEALARRRGIANLRGTGLLQAFDLDVPRAADLVDAARSRGLLLNSPRPSTIRLMPPLVVEPPDLVEFAEILDASLDQVLAPKEG